MTASASSLIITSAEFAYNDGRVGTGISLDDALGEDLAACIDHTELAALAADVYTYYVIFIHIILPGYLC